MTTMTPESVVGRLGRRPGQKLLTYREVGLPFWDVPMRCRFLAKKALPAIDEFVLRSVEAGLRTRSEIESFLGLPFRVVETVMGDLINSGHLTPQAGSTGTISFVLTERGNTAVRDMMEIIPEDKTISLAFDGLLHRYMYVDQSLRWRPQDLRRNDLLEIPAFPADPPDVDPTLTSSVASVIREETADAEQELLAVLGLDGRREKFFRRALAMVFQSIDRADDVSVVFAIDGRLSDEHGSAFARAEGRRKLGIVGMLRESDSPASEVLGHDVVSQLADDAEVTALRLATEGFRDQLRQLEQRSVEADDEQKDLLAAEVEEVEHQIDEAEAALSRLPVRLIEVHEHPALATAQERLLIVSPWVRAAVVNDDFIRSVEELSGRSVEVTIAYGIDDGRQGSRNDKIAEERLSEVAQRYSCFHFVRLGDTHAKILLVDERFVVATSYNWLSFRGDPNRPFRDERGTLVSIPDEIDRIYRDYMARVSAHEESQQ